MPGKERLAPPGREPAEARPSAPATERSRRMSAIDRRTVNELAATTGPGSLVSLYLPTHRAGREIRQGPIRLKNLLREAAEQLEQAGMTGTEVSERLAPATALLEHGTFWEHQKD